MNITRKEFSELKKGDVLIDFHGREWSVLSDAEQRDSFFCIMVENPNKEYEELSWMDLGKDNSGIMDEEIALMIELNHADAHIRKSSQS